MYLINKTNVLIYTLILILGLSGCNNTPNIRRGSIAATTLGIPFIHPRPPFLNPHKLGSHSYFPNPFEKNGIVYTCDGGHIDISHVRANADDTRFFVGKIYNTLIENKNKYSFGLAFEQSWHTIEFTYPENWKQLTQDERQKIAREISMEAGAFVTFHATLWHEIMSWFGVRFAIFDPQFNSAFSWEDVYSNILGVKIAIQALNDTEHDYNKAVTIAINKELDILRVIPRKKAMELTETMRGKWFKGTFVADMIRRNTDIGIDDGFVSPVIIPEACEDAKARPIEVPKLEKMAAHGFSMTYKIKPVYLEGYKVLKIAHPEKKAKTIEPVMDYPKIIEYINKKAVEKYNYDIGK
jgi:hypothetical protein